MPEPTSDLAAAIREMDDWLLSAKTVPDVPWRNWPAIRAALERQAPRERRERELREALEELVRGSGLLALSEYWAAVSQAKALLARSAEEVGERG